jgi:hypothetical protein
MAPQSPTRTEKRKGFDMGVRMSLAEQDLDSQEGMMTALLEENKKGNKLLTGILAALSGGAILLALDLASRGLGAG